MFEYQPGESHASVRRAALPGRPATLDLLPEPARETAKAICADTGVTHQALLDACALDVACSGGDASQADWITRVEPPASVLDLDVGPARVRLARTFAATAGAYSDTEDLDAACRDEFGPDAKLADWLDVKGIPLESISSWLNAIGLTTYNADELYLMVGGQRLWSAPRHYFIVWHDHRPVSGFLTHDTIDNSLVDLGSWYGWNRRVLCQVCQDGPCGSAVGSQPTNPGTSCSDIVEREGARADGNYWVLPAGASVAFEAECDMTIDGGGWARLTREVASTLDTTSDKTYLYFADGRWYRSPKTKLAWSWSSGQVLTGNRMQECADREEERALDTFLLCRIERVDRDYQKFIERARKGNVRVDPVNGVYSTRGQSNCVSL